MGALQFSYSVYKNQFLNLANSSFYYLYNSLKNSLVELWSTEPSSILLLLTCHILLCLMSILLY